MSTEHSANITTWKTQSFRRENVPSATLSTINSTPNALRKNLGLCCEKPVTNCLIYGMAKRLVSTNYCLTYKL
jgi:hypothetical protein